MALDPDRRRQIHAVKLRTLAAEVLDLTLDESVGTNDGAVGYAPGVVVALAEERCHRALGPALAAAAREDETVAIHVLAEKSSQVLARRAGEFDRDINVWEIEGRTAKRAEPCGFDPAAEAPAVPELVALLTDSGVDVVVEHGVVVGEVEGLEVARVFVDELGERLEVGVGVHDREAFSIIHGDMPTPAALAKVVDVVRKHRAPGADPHPLNRLGAERWLRSKLIADPSRIGAERLQTAPPPVVRTNLKEPVPAVALGEMSDGGDVVVVTAVGIDLDLVPFAADARVNLDPSAELMLVVPARDAHLVTRRMAEGLHRPARVVPVDDGWRQWPVQAPVA